MIDNHTLLPYHSLLHGSPMKNGSRTSARLGKVYIDEISSQWKSYWFLSSIRTSPSSRTKGTLAAFSLITSCPSKFGGNGLSIGIERIEFAECIAQITHLERLYPSPYCKTRQSFPSYQSPAHCIATPRMPGTNNKRDGPARMPGSSSLHDPVAYQVALLYRLHEILLHAHIRNLAGRFIGNVKLVVFDLELGYLFHCLDLRCWYKVNVTV